MGHGRPGDEASPRADRMCLQREVLAELAALSGELVPDGEQASLSVLLIPDDPAAVGEALDVGDAGLGHRTI
jgi:hypothetical protein